MYSWDGARQRALRKAVGMPPEALALVIHRSADAISSYETGRAVPPVGIAHQIATELGVTVADLLAEEVPA